MSRRSGTGRKILTHVLTSGRGLPSFPLLGPLYIAKVLLRRGEKQKFFPLFFWPSKADSRKEGESRGEDFIFVWKSRPSFIRFVVVSPQVRAQPDGDGHGAEGFSQGELKSLNTKTICCLFRTSRYCVCGTVQCAHCHATYRTSLVEKKTFFSPCRTTKKSNSEIPLDPEFPEPENNYF